MYGWVKKKKDEKLGESLYAKNVHGRVQGIAANVGIVPAASREEVPLDVTVL